MSCPVESVPPGWRVWRGPVPPALGQFAVDVRDKIRQYPYGSIANTIAWGDSTVGAFVSHHTYTSKNGKLITGICIPGVSLVYRPTAGDASQPPFQDSLDPPDPNAAVYAAEGIDWQLVALSGLAGAGVVLLFVAAMKHAGKSPKRLQR